MGTAQSEDKTPFYTLLVAVILLGLTLILPVFVGSVDFGMFGSTSESFSVFDVLSGFGILIYFSSITLGGIATKRANDFQSGFGYSIGAFILSGFIILVFGSIQDDIHAEFGPLVQFDYALGYYTAFFGMIAVLVGGFLSRRFNDSATQHQRGSQGYFQEPQYQQGYAPQPQSTSGQELDTTSQTTQTGSPQKSLFCTNCGTQASGKFCPECGQRIN